MALKVSWVLDWPDATQEGIPTSSDRSMSNDQLPQRRRQQTWKGRLQAAYVDGEQGWIDKDDPVPGGIQFTRALKKYDLVDERIEGRVRYENGIRTGSDGRMKFHWWGRDEEV